LLFPVLTLTTQLPAITVLGTVHSLLLAVFVALSNCVFHFSVTLPDSNRYPADDITAASLLAQMAAYPPALSDSQLDELLALALDWGSAHGLVVGAPDAPAQRLVHAPLALLPSPFPRGCFEEARSLQTLFNQLMDRVSRDDDFLVGIFEE
jgi:hypothetical protein